MALAAWTAARLRAMTLAWVAVALYALVTVGPIGEWMSNGGPALHTAQHLALFSIIAPMLLAGIGGIGIPPTGRNPMAPRIAALMLLAGIAIFWVSLLAPAVKLAHGGTVFDALMHALLLGAGAIVHLPIASRRALQGFGAAIYLLLCEILIGAAGIVIAWAPQLLYDPVVYEHSAFGFSPKTDQALAGALILVLEEPLLAVEFAFAFIAGLRESERRLEAEDQQTDRSP